MPSIHPAMPAPTPAPRFSGKTNITDLETVQDAVLDTFGYQESLNVNNNTISSPPKGPLAMLRHIVSSLIASRVNGGSTHFSLTRYDSTEERDKAWQDKLDNWGSPNSRTQEKDDESYRFSDHSMGIDFDVWLAKSGEDSIVLMNRGTRSK